MTLSIMALCQPKLTEQVKHCVKQSRSYPTHNEPRIVYDLLQACSKFPRLAPVVEDFSIRPDCKNRLVALRGAISVTTATQTYLLPLIVWVMPYYPKGPPLLYVVPSSQNATIQPNHPYVDAATGMVFSSYLSEWNVNSNICHALTHTLYNFAATDPPFAPSFPLLPASLATVTEQSQSLVLTLSRRATSALASINLNSRHTIRNLTQSKLALEQQLRLDRDTDSCIRSLTATRNKLRARLQQLRQWHLHHPTPPEEATIDDVTKLRLTTHQQYLKSVSLDHATSDTLDQMDDVVSLGRLSLEAYILRVRRLARAQFFNRALAAAIAKKADDNNQTLPRTLSLWSSSSKATFADTCTSIPHPSVRVSVLGQPT